MKARRSLRLLALILFATGCADSGSGDTYIRYTIDGQTYTAEHVTFTISDLNRPGWKAVGVSMDVARPGAFDPPAASLLWRMELADPRSLEGRTIAIRNLNDPGMADPLISFTLPGEVTIANMATTNVNLTVSSIGGGIVEGSFRGSGLEVITDHDRRTVDVSGTFRAQLLD